MSGELERGMKALGEYGEREAIERAFPNRTTRFLTFWYDGNQSRVSLLDFGNDPAFGPFGNEDLIKDQLADWAHGRDGRSVNSGDVMLAGMVHVVGTEDTLPSVILEDQEIDAIEVIAIKPR